MSLLSHAQTELALLSKGEPDEMQEAMNICLLNMVELFASQRHSGLSAAYVISNLDKLLDFEPLTPLTGADDEWEDISEYGGPLHQNKRCSRVFKRSDGTAFDVQGIVFRRPDGTTFTSERSNVTVAFPYMPETKYVDVPDDRA